jgi:hypothetical protein
MTTRTLSSLVARFGLVAPLLAIQCLLLWGVY